MARDHILYKHDIVILYIDRGDRTPIPSSHKEHSPIEMRHIGGEFSQSRQAHTIADYERKGHDRYGRQVKELFSHGGVQLVIIPVTTPADIEHMLKERGTTATRVLGYKSKRSLGKTELLPAAASLSHYSVCKRALDLFAAGKIQGGTFIAAEDNVKFLFDWQPVNTVWKYVEAMKEGGFDNMNCCLTNNRNNFPKIAEQFAAPPNKVVKITVWGRVMSVMTEEGARKVIIERCEAHPILGGGGRNGRLFADCSQLSNAPICIRVG